MLTHVTIGFDDLDKARSFYDHVLEPLGYVRVLEMPNGSGYGQKGGAPMFFLLNPRDGKAASAGNGFTVGLIADSRKGVDEFHKRALAKGGKDEGAPGPRPMGPNMYMAYIRDIGGHKVCVMCNKPE